MSASEIEPFHAIAISRLAHQMKAEGRSVIHMEFGQPSTGAPKAAIERAHTVLDTDSEYRIVVLRDMTASIQAHQRMDFLTQHDLLTRLP